MIVVENAILWAHYSLLHFAISFNDILEFRYGVPTFFNNAYVSEVIDCTTCSVCRFCGLKVYLII